MKRFVRTKMISYVRTKMMDRSLIERSIIEPNNIESLNHDLLWKPFKMRIFIDTEFLLILLYLAGF